MWTVISIVLTVIALLCSSLALFWSVRSVIHGRELRRSWQACKPLQNELLDTRLTECEESIRLLANRVKMQKVRNAITHADRDKGGEPDAQSNPEAWRAWKNSQLRAGVFNS